MPVDFIMVPGAGLEPARSYLRGILSPLRLPISPPGRFLGGLVLLLLHAAKTLIWKGLYYLSFPYAASQSN